MSAAAPLRLTLGYSLAFTAAACFGVGGIIAKAAFNAGLPPSVLAEWRILFGFAVYALLFGALRPAAFRIARADIPLVALFGVVGLAGVQWSYYESIQRLPIGVAVVIQYTAPVLLLIWARLRGRRVGGRLWVAAALALVGCFLAAGAYDAALFELNTTGLALSVLSAFIFALYFSLAERILARYGTPTLLVYGFGFALLAWAIFRPLWTLPWLTTPREIYLLLAGVLVVATVIPFGLTLAAVKLIPAARVGLTATIEPVVAAIVAWLVLGEHLALAQIAGGALVLAGILIAQSLRPTAGSV
ncbi:MAG TPA: DMT family transporter [Candidatus Limnocylindria bacterium]|nr:DMT family transporter [Candidatus Limnocylindria bacterium]